MRAAVVHGPGDLRIDELPDPQPGEDEVLIAVEWGGICGSDTSYYRHGVSGTAQLRHPLVLGHEIAGRLVELGTRVTGLEVGQPVTVHPATLVGDGVMPERLAGRTNLYTPSRYFGSAAFDPHTDGGFSGFRTARADQVRVLPDGVSTQHGALAEPLGVAFHAVGRPGKLHGKTVLVNGAGPIGSLVVAAAKFCGADTVIASDVSDRALEIARRMGADETVNVASGGTLPPDAEIVFEASGSPRALGPVLRATARGGTLVQVGNLPGSEIQTVLGDLVTREITWIGSYRFVDEITDAVEALGDGLDVSPLITHTFELEQAAEAMHAALDPDSGSSKVMLHIG
ncbi:L-idonate 5-dehydrogenase [Kineosporia mesophila]|uniref:L-idonate 5-dehydrogenase n=1 Tax=Kineosporia mesophila TaxID=566012 RepID=A0ABP7AUH6_9ACTN|nr:L-idonate 5-dehydrogenase [Kineosporia mesophila]MCD5354152.1 L-idonate 5-dehydrogenase [Kineosporia mesophila]